VLLQSIVVNRALFLRGKSAAGHPRAVSRMTKFPLGSPRQVLSFLRPYRHDFDKTCYTKERVGNETKKELVRGTTKLVQVISTEGTHFFFGERTLFLKNVPVPFYGGTGSNILYLSGVHKYFISE
jgi:hypothetical protein